MLESAVSLLLLCKTHKILIDEGEVRCILNIARYHVCVQAAVLQYGAFTHGLVQGLSWEGERTSARVGVGLVIMDSSMLVATITGLPLLRQPWTIFDCQKGTYVTRRFHSQVISLLLMMTALKFALSRESLVRNLECAFIWSDTYPCQVSR